MGADGPAEAPAPNPAPADEPAEPQTDKPSADAGRSPEPASGLAETAAVKPDELTVDEPDLDDPAS